VPANAKCPTGKVCFTCTAKGGREVRLYKSTYYAHIVNPNRHPEILRDYEFPVSEIENALINATRGPSPEASKRRVSFMGPLVTPRPPKIGLEQWKVVVEPDDTGNSGWVVTAYPIVALN
jgi:hypothetical protein